MVSHPVRASQEHFSTPASKCPSPDVWRKSSICLSDRKPLHLSGMQEGSTLIFSSRVITKHLTIREDLFYFLTQPLQRASCVGGNPYALFINYLLVISVLEILLDPPSLHRYTDLPWGSFLMAWNNTVMMKW